LLGQIASYIYFINLSTAPAEYFMNQPPKEKLGGQGLLVWRVLRQGGPDLFLTRRRQALAVPAVHSPILAAVSGRVSRSHFANFSVCADFA
jgi:hypothetical protein